MVSEHLTVFRNKPVQEYSPATGIADPINTVYRIAISYDNEDVTIEQLIDAFAADPKAGQVEELIIGQFSTEMDNSTDVVMKLISHRTLFKGLKALFIGDITYEECEISWIKQENMEPLLEAYPGLVHFQVRGGEDLAFGNLQHDQLQTLIVETGGMPPNVIKEISAARLPNLERLDLWLGSENYGFASGVEDFDSLLSGKTFPKLTHLGLMNSEIQDDLAIAVSTAPVLQQLKVLDLSMGTLSDEGAKALLNSPGIRQLTFLNLRRHYLSEDMMQQLQSLGVGINVDDRQTDDEYRYAEVTE
ncbi:STM4015 family protein [Paraflavitalea pollutisoli]|uniref:STM4015 family protein n=1 Tax=Paraflavitalea pollutisoli TaxID=3034143 RepID=UPI0023EC38E4|nr:STM4015 family protein [Paraflavitalea sp. H1-2-19X]